MDVLGLRVVGVDVLVEGDPASIGLLRHVYGGMAVGEARPALHYRITSTSGVRELSRGTSRVSAPTDADLLWEFDRDLIIEIQRQRAELYFVHAAVLEHRGRALLIVAPSGTGKSTLAWTLVHRGLRFLSDELAPIDIRQLCVEPFPRALYLKDAPHPPYAVPAATTWTDEALQVGVEALPSSVCAQRIPIAGIFFLRRPPNAAAPAVAQLSSSDGAQRLYSNALNALAHEHEGLQGAVRVASGCRCYELIAASPTDTANLAIQTANLADAVASSPSH